jgi:hypothetical protein
LGLITTVGLFFSNIFQQGSYAFLLQDQITHSVFADAIFKLVAEVQVVVFQDGLKVLETQCGQPFEVFAYFIEM